MQTAQKTERQTMKAFSVGVAWPAYFIKTHDRQQTGGREGDGDPVFVFEPTDFVCLSLFILLS